MPKITIFEKDVTTPTRDDISSNIVYVPGYAIAGPVNTPTLCTTVEEFKAIFGSEPYTFKSLQTYPMFSKESGKSGFTSSAITDKTCALPASYERSYVYASDILNSGLPVLFERVMSTESIADYTATAKFNFSGDDYFVIKAKVPGTLYTKIKYNITDNNSVYTLKLDASDIKEIELMDEELVFSFDPNNSNYYQTIKSELVDFEIIGNVGTSITIATQDGSLKIEKTTDEFTVENFYKDLNSDNLFSKLSDRNEYQVKFVTSGSYPVFEYNEYDSGIADTNAKINPIAIKMLEAAALRGDAIALLDHTNNPNRSLLKIHEEVKKIPETLVGEGTKIEDARKYGAMFTPWATYQSSELDANIILPGSFAYLVCLGKSNRTFPNWYATAGVTRGLVPNLKQLSQTVTGAMANAVQGDVGIAMNPITNINPYGYCIWGNRTLNNNNGLVASSFLNIRMLSNDVKKKVYEAAKKLTFELNDNILWLNFKSEIEPTLDKMVSGNGLSGYKLIRKTSKKKATIEAVIKLYAIEAVESWDITIELSDSYVAIQ